MRRGAITRESVLKAAVEHDELGREAFLSKYGFGEARSYVLVHEGREYDSKAIAGVAHKWAQGRALAPGEFSGGKDHAAAWLKRLGFQVKAVKNPDWARDEVILACHLVMMNGWKGLDAQDSRVIELSGLLQLLPIHSDADRNDKFRNPNGVARKTFDIATRHPDYRGKPTNGGAVDVEVLHEFLARPDEMTEVARLIREGITTGELQALTQTDDDEHDDDFEAPEGRLLLRRHRTRERNKGLRKKKIDSVRRKGRSLACEACGFDFEEVYGERGAGYVECHHVVPLHEAGEGRTKLDDLALICANCHRMIHRRAPWPTPAELRTAIEHRRSTQIRPLSRHRAAARPTHRADRHTGDSAMTEPADPVLLFDEEGRIFVLHDSALGSELIESEDEFLEGYDGQGRPVRASGEPGQVHLSLVSTEAQDDELRARVERYYSVFAARHPTRIPPQEADLVAFIQAVADDWVEE